MNKIVPSKQASFFICSLNCEGFNRNTDYIRDVLATRKPDMFCLQETWLLDSQGDDLNSVHQGYLSLSKSGVDLTSHILPGRPKVISRYIKPIKVNSRWICAAELTGCGNNNIVVLCVYMPCDNRLMHTCNAEYEATLNEVAVLINMYDGHQFIRCGDN